MMLVRFENWNSLMYISDDTKLRKECGEVLVELFKERIKDG